MAYKQNKIFTTPYGTGCWLNLQIPQLYENKPRFAGDIGKYSADISVDGSDTKVQAWMDDLGAYCEELLNEWKDEQKKPNHSKIPDETKWLPIKEDLDEEGNSTGLLRIVARANANGVIKRGPREGQMWSTTIPIVDSQKRAMSFQEKPEDLPRILGKGTRLRINIEPSVYAVAGTEYCRVSFKLHGVQVSHPEWRGGGPGAASFDDVEDEMDTIADLSKDAGGDF